MIKNIAVIRGDGIGPEIVREAVKVLDRVAEVYGHTFNYTDVCMGGEAIDRFGEPLPEAELDRCKRSDSVLLGAVGGEKWNNVPAFLRPEKGLLKLRKELGVYANNRPCRVWKQIAEASPLRREFVDEGIDFVIVRELTGGIYFGRHEESSEGGMRTARDTLTYSEEEIARIARVAFDMARLRRGRVCSVDKSNVLSSSRLWREVVSEVSRGYPDVELSHMLVDNCAMQLVKRPSQFDVIVTENMFGDILSDEASMLTGSIGMIPSSSTGEGERGLYEPIHGSAPDIAGRDIANPIGTILASAMMLRYSFGMQKEADAVERAVSAMLDKGYRTAVIMQKSSEKILLSCSQAGEKIAELVE